MSDSFSQEMTNQHVKEQIERERERGDFNELNIGTISFAVRVIPNKNSNSN